MRPPGSPDKTWNIPLFQSWPVSVRFVSHASSDRLWRLGLRPRAIFNGARRFRSAGGGETNRAWLVLVFVASHLRAWRPRPSSLSSARLRLRLRRLAGVASARELRGVASETKPDKHGSWTWCATSDFRRGEWLVTAYCLNALPCAIPDCRDRASSPEAPARVSARRGYLL